MTILNKNYIIYVIVAVIIFSLFDVFGTIETIKLKTLNRLRPYPQYLSQYIDERENIKNDHAQLNNFITYYKYVDKYVPGRSDTNSMLGFCYYLLGDYSKAIDYYKKAVKYNPQFFWGYYNLGILYYQIEDYAQALDNFEKAVAVSGGRTLEYLHTSVVYLHLLSGSKVNPGPEVAKRLDKDFNQTMLWIIKTHLKLKQFEQALKMSEYALRSNLEDDTIYYYYAGVSAYHLKNYGHAAILLRKYLILGQENGEAYLYLSKALDAINQKKGAIQAKVLSRRYANSPLKEKVMKVKIF